MNDHIPDLTKMISDTPISDSTPHNVADLGMLCRRLERELNAANERIKQLKEDLMNAKNKAAGLVADVVLYEDRAERIKRLEEAGDAVMKSLSCGCPHGDSVFHCRTCTNSWDAWHKAKEAKP